MSERDWEVCRVEQFVLPAGRIHFAQQTSLFGVKCHGGGGLRTVNSFYCLVTYSPAFRHKGVINDSKTDYLPCQ